jgi:hypothetical protein
VDLPEALISLLDQPSTCYIATTMPDGSPQLTQTWVDTEGEHILINTVQGFQKVQQRRARPARGRYRLRPGQPPTLLRGSRARSRHHR